MADDAPLNRNQLLILDFVEKHPGCLFESLLDHMKSQQIKWQDWYPDNYQTLLKRNLIISDFWPQPDARHPDRVPGDVKLFPKLSITDTDYSNEPLSDDARAVLAFIRDHPGLKDSAIMKQMRLAEGSFVLAIRLLEGHKLVRKQFVPYPNPPAPHMVPGYSAYYPA